MNVFQSSPTNQGSNVLFESFSQGAFGTQFSQGAKLLLNRYEQMEKIGSGSYGSVFKCRDASTGEIVAIKKFYADFENLSEVEEMKELQVLQRFSHPNIIETKKIDIENNKLMIVFEHLDLNLTEFIREKNVGPQNPFSQGQHRSPELIKQKSQNNQISEEDILIIVKQILLGLDYMHEKGFIHRDLKPENFMIDPNTLELKIIDFGTVKDIANSNPPFTTYICTRWYRAPECVLRAENYGTASDIFAVGCIMAELFNLKPLFPGNSELDQVDQIIKVVGSEKFSKWKDGQRLARKMGYNLEIHHRQKQLISKLIPTASPEAQQILKQMIKLNPSKRPSARQLLNYPIFKNSAAFKKGAGIHSAFSPTLHGKNNYQVDNDEVFQAAQPQVGTQNKHQIPANLLYGADFARGDSFGLQNQINNLKDMALKAGIQHQNFGDDELLQNTHQVFQQKPSTCVFKRGMELEENEYDMALMYQKGAIQKGFSPKEGFSFASRVQEERRKSNIFNQPAPSFKSQNDVQEDEDHYKKTSNSFEKLKVSTQNYASSFNNKSCRGTNNNQKSYDNIFKTTNQKPFSLTQNNSPQLLSANIRKSSYNQSPVDRDQLLDCQPAQNLSSQKEQEQQDGKPEKGFLLRNDSFGSL